MMGGRGEGKKRDSFFACFRSKRCGGVGGRLVCAFGGS